MEELLSTDVLDREILEDARKKAYHILKASDESVKSVAELWENKTTAAIAESRKHYASRFVTMRDEIMARLLLDKRRVRSEKIESLLKTAMVGYLQSLPRETLLSLLENEVRLRLTELQETSEFPTTGVTVQIRNLSSAESEAILKKYLTPGTWTLETTSTAMLVEDKFPRLMLDAPSVRINASIDNVGYDLLEDKRTELLVALLGDAALEGGLV
ncbi:MAG: ATPase [Treponema sp.]|jgi:vacuolar-type H+-ATPase subunit E/Vma4|nr:ATPase [Treponema sp.]